ncbi:MAG TPA: hypothetical protein VHJ99_17245 [Candidatus Dormibacteraeota bacterium]|nr:hypothetical protein [Candidatus Dormibacteraeota bacterium]
MTEPRQIQDAAMTLRAPRDAGEVSSLAWSLDGNSLAVGFERGLILIWDGQGRAARHRGPYLTNGSWVMSLAWSPDGGALAAATSSGKLYIFDTGTWIAASSTPVAGASLRRVAWRPGAADELAVTDHEGNVAVCTRYCRVLRTLKTGLEDQRGLVWLGGRHLAVGGAGTKGRSNLAIFDPDSGARFELRGHRDKVLALAAPPATDLLASGTDDSIRIWSALDGRPLRILEGHTGAVYSLTFSADGLFLASSSQDDTVRLWRTDSWEAVAVLIAEGTHNPVVAKRRGSVGLMLRPPRQQRNATARFEQLVRHPLLRSGALAVS